MKPSDVFSMILLFFFAVVGGVMARGTTLSFQVTKLIGIERDYQGARLVGGVLGGLCLLALPGKVFGGGNSKPGPPAE